MTKSISILIPAYNSEKVITQCLKSIAQQSFTDYEVIVSDDGSTDNTAQLVTQFKTEHPGLDVTLVTNPNGGVSLARKRALEQAKGKWVAFVDSDDSLPPNSLSYLIKYATDETDLVVGFLIPPSKEIQPFKTPQEWQHGILQGLIPPSAWGKLYRRIILQPTMFDIPRGITNGEDALLNIAYAFAMIKPPKFVYKSVYNYTRNPISLSHTTKRVLDYEYAYDRFRMKAIPEAQHNLHMHSVTKYRLNGLLGCCMSDAETIARKEHPFFDIIQSGIKQSGYRLSMFEWIAMNSKSTFIIRYSGLIRMILISLNYRVKSFFRK